MISEAKLKISELYGTMGVLAYDPIEDKVECHICGKWFRGLNTHIRQRHNYTTDDYREEFGLNRCQSLICEGTKQKLSAINKKLDHWKHLYSQTMTKDELTAFLRNIHIRGYKLRTQELARKSKVLLEHNPMSSPELLQRRTTTLRKTWYGSPRMREISRLNQLVCVAKVRQRNLRQKKWKCPCGDLFSIREELRKHIKLVHRLNGY